MIEAPAVPEIAPWQADRYRLWSLLDMLRFYAGNFTAAVCNLQTAKDHVIYADG